MLLPSFINKQSRVLEQNAISTLMFSSLMVTPFPKRSSSRRWEGQEAQCLLGIQVVTVGMVTIISMLGTNDMRSQDASWPASLALSASPRFSESLCLKNKTG